jgi:arabinogalactan oligomer/maltooligosaccharide transport system permease protein
MKKILLSLSISILIIATVFTIGCGGNVEKPKSITIWHQMASEGRVVLDSIAQSWGRQHGYSITVLYKETEELRSAFQIAALAGGGPELVYGPSDQVGPFKTMNLIMPLDDLFDSDFLASFDPIGLVKFEGNLYQIADRIGNHLCLVYNKALVPQPPQTTDELIEIGKKLTSDSDGDGNPDNYGLVWNYTEPYFFVPWLGGFGGWVMNKSGEPTLDTQANIDALAFLVYLRDSARIVPRELDYDIADALFKEGKAAMIINGPWSWGGYRNAGIDFAIARIPKVSATDKWPVPMVSPKGYSINKSTDPAIIPAVVELVKFLISAESQLAYTKILGTIPSNIEARESDIVADNPIIAASISQMEVGRPMPIVPELRAVWDAMRPPYQAVLGGSMTPKEAAAEMQSLAVKKIAEMNE